MEHLVGQAPRQLRGDLGSRAPALQQSQGALELVQPVGFHDANLGRGRAVRLTQVKPRACRCATLRRMFKHILIPTDGSKLSTRGIKAGVKLAKALGARVTALHVIPPYLPVMYSGLDGHTQGAARRNFKTNSERAARLALAAAEREARAAGVRCKASFTTDPEPWGGILRTARCGELRCHRHGLARTQRPRRPDPRQRDAARARAFEAAGAGGALSACSGTS